MNPNIQINITLIYVYRKTLWLFKKSFLYHANEKTVSMTEWVFKKNN